MSWLGETDDYNKEDSLGEFNNDRYIEDLSEDNMDLNTNNNFIEEESEYANKDIKLKVPLPVILFLIAIIAISVFSMIRFPSTLQDYKIYKNAKERIKNGETSQTLNDLHTLVEKYPDSLPIVIRTIEQCMENGYYDNAGYLHNTYMVGKSISDSEYEWVNKYLSWLDDYYNTLDQIEIIFNQLSEDDATEEELDYAEIENKLKDLLYKEDTSNAVVYYYLALVTDSTKQAIEYLEECYEADPECFDVRVRLAIMYRRVGDFEKARKFTDEALGKDKIDSGALRSLAILHMLEQNMEEALKVAEEAYNNYSDGEYIRETYLIALHFNDLIEEAQVIKNEIIELQGQLEEETQKLLEGEITLEEYYVEG
ncbi:tetratricopeptide repeat protein [Herbinix luporum]|nr:tetratricopeptide repeat protein [Herbinix luporum]